MAVPHLYAGKGIGARMWMTEMPAPFYNVSHPIRERKQPHVIKMANHAP